MITLQGQSIAMLRTQLEIAQQLAKYRIGFVVVPMLSDAEMRTFCEMQRIRLEQIAAAAEDAASQPIPNNGA